MVRKLIKNTVHPSNFQVDFKQSVFLYFMQSLTLTRQVHRVQAAAAALWKPVRLIKNHPVIIITHSSTYS